MKVTVCELPNEPAALEDAWKRLCDHVRRKNSEFVLLPEMPFYLWLAHTRDIRHDQWEAAVQAHHKWIARFGDLAPAVVASTRPVIRRDDRHNVGFVWDAANNGTDVHTKYYLPDEAGFWEASWYSRGKKMFEGFETARGKVGFLICTELWFARHAREYGQQGVQLLVCPRATPASTARKWLVGGQFAAVASGAYCLSSNLCGKRPDEGEFAGMGWIIEPEAGEVLGTTTPAKPFLTLEIDLSYADAAKQTYPRYVRD